MEIPVYLFTGFLESGKTKFIQETLEDERFNSGEYTLLVICEEGEEEYEPSLFSGKNVFLKTVDDEEQLSSDLLAGWLKETGSERVIIEYNGMWNLQTLYDALPKKWTIYQEMMFADSNTFVNFNANMRSLVVDKLKSAELVIFNRFSDNVDKMSLHKIVRGIQRNNIIIYEYLDGSTEQDTIEDPLPFDINSDVIEIADTDYALFYRDLMEETEKYNGKIVKFKGLSAKDKKMEPNEFVTGRHVMTCCADDIQYAGLMCKCSSNCIVKTGDWLNITAEIVIEYNKAYRSKGPVLKVSEYSLTSEPQEKIVTF